MVEVLVDYYYSYMLDSNMCDYEPHYSRIYQIDQAKVPRNGD